MSERVEPAAWRCKFDGSIHRRGVHHEGDEPLVPACEPGCKPGGACRWVGCQNLVEDMTAVLLDNGYEWDGDDTGPARALAAWLRERDALWSTEKEAE